MKSYEYAACKICGVWGFTDAHRCRPEWEWRCDSHLEDEWDSHRVRASDAESAAIEAAAIYDQEDYPLSRGNEAVIWIRLVDGDDVSKWNVMAVSEPQYYASEVDA